MRVLPVEDTCALEVGAIEAAAKKLAAKHFPESASPITVRSTPRSNARACMPDARCSTQFAVRAEQHSPKLKGGVVAGDLVRRVANQVSQKHVVKLNSPRMKTIILMLVGVRALRVCTVAHRVALLCCGGAVLMACAGAQEGAMLSCVEHWHELHKFNVHEERKEVGEPVA